MWFAMAQVSDEKIPEITKELLMVGVDADSDPTAAVVQIALMSSETVEPTDLDWNPAGWSGVTRVILIGGKYVSAWIFSTMVSGIGLGGTIELSPGTYWVWGKVADAGQAMVRQVGKLTVT